MLLCICIVCFVSGHALSFVQKVKRLGGGFGGKETRNAPVSAAVALAAQKFRKPVAIMLDRDEDMKTSGGRHPFYGEYTAAATKDGRLVALEVDLYV